MTQLRNNPQALALVGTDLADAFERYVDQMIAQGHVPQQARDALLSDASGDILAAELTTALTSIGAHTLFKSCSNCMHRGQQNGVYCNKHKGHPPMETLLTGCSAHAEHGIDEEIPF